MLLSDLLSVTESVRQTLTSTTIVDKLGELRQILSQMPKYSAELSKQLNMNIAKIRTGFDVFAAMANELSPTRRRIYKGIGFERAAGPDARRQFDELVGHALGDPVGAAARMQHIQDAFTSAAQMATQLGQGLAPIVRSGQSDKKPPREEYAIGLMFDKDIDINTLDDLAIAAKDWRQTIRTLQELTGSHVEPISLSNLEKGSTWLELTTTCTPLIAAMLLVGKELFATLKEYYAFQRTRMELLKHTSKDDDVVARLEAKSKEMEKQIAEVVSSKLIEKYATDVDSHKGELDGKVNRAVSSIMNFVNGGGSIKIELIGPGGEERQKELNAFNDSHRAASLAGDEVRQLEGARRQLADGNKPDGDDN